jgi:hypothetical protein
LATERLAGAVDRIDAPAADAAPAEWCYGCDIRDIRDKFLFFAILSRCRKAARTHPYRRKMLSRAASGQRLPLLRCWLRDAM